MDNYRDYFSREQLLASVAQAQFIPGAIGASGLFQTIGLTGTTLAIESLPDDNVSEVSAIPRGAPPNPLLLEKRSVETFVTKTYAFQGTVLADEVLNVRSASNAAEVLTQRRDALTAKLRRQADWQMEYMRVGCVNSATNAFGTSPAAEVVAFGSSDTVAVNVSIHTKIVLALESALGGITYTGIDAWCSDTYWQALIQSKTMRETYLNTAAANQLRGLPLDSIEYGNVTWHRYRAGGNIAITSGTAKIVPRGVPGLFMQAYAPNDTLSSVGTGEIGQPYYLDSYPLADDKGFRLTLQMHPVVICTRPTAVLTVDLS